MAAALVGSVAVTVVLAEAQAASADTAPPPGVSPVASRPADMVTADALPTVQIDGVVWSEALAGNTVWAGGEFKNARPAGAASGTSLTPRANLLAFDITTGNLITSINPSTNAQVKSVAVTPDKSKIIIGGSFTQANGQVRNHVAEYDSQTGQLIASFAPNVSGGVYSVSATNSTVFVGGAFSTVNGQPRTDLAAVDITTGALLSWAPTTDASVNAVQVSPDGQSVFVGGSFSHVNGANACGLAKIDLTGALLPLPATNIIYNCGSSAAFLNLSTDGTAIYTSSYVYGAGGNFEGNASIDPTTGKINFLADCHGDTYGTFGQGSVLYSVSHQHFCTNIGGFPDTSPRNRWYRTTAFTKQVTGTVQNNTQGGGGYGNFGGQASPSLIDWTPELAAGTYTGQTQAAWAITGNAQYVVEGGEFPTVNLKAQQGLVRFAIPSIAPRKQGPRLTGGQLNLAGTPRSTTSVRLTWTANWDRDDRDLTYTVYRNKVAVKAFVASSESWNLPAMGFIDTGLAPGTTYSYKVRATDADGNYADSSTISANTATTGSPDGAYVQDVLNQGATHFWRLDQASGATTNQDYAGFDDLALSSGVGAGATGAINDGDTASTFDGSTNGFGSSGNAVPGPNVFTEEAWFQTTSTTGGKIVGFGDRNTGNSSNYDRHIFMNAAGQLTFGVYNSGGYTISTGKSYNDGQWHQVVGTLAGDGMHFYVDGRLIGTNTGTTVGQPYTGYWRVGGDSSWADANYFTGTIDEVSIYPAELSLAQIQQQYSDSGRSISGATAPSDNFGKTVWNDGPSNYYRLDETGGSTAADRSPNSDDGTISGSAGSVTFGTASPVGGNGGTGYTFNGTDGTIASTNPVNNPTTYSEEIWFNTTSTSGGKLIGFGDNRSGYSNSYDRHIYMLADGRLVFGTYTGQLNLATSTASYNDGTWHQAVATQGPNGMVLYVDGVAVATNGQTSAQAYTGYWRIGGDNLNGWGANGAFFSGTLDEAAVYPTVLTAAQVQAHYQASGLAPNQAPTAAFTSQVAGGTVTFDGTGSSDPDGNVASYAWDFGDGSTGTGATPSHTYGVTGTYNVTLTVTDNSGAPASVSHTVTVTVNRKPSAAFTSQVSGLSASFDASGSSDPDGDTLSYAWNFGDGTTGTGVTPTHTYSQGGSYSVTLTVTDPGSLSDTATHSVVASTPNRAPSAAFTSSANYLTVAFDGSGSSDPDGDALTYAWSFGDGTSGSGVAPTHTYTAAGAYTVTLTVSDPGGLTGTATHQVSVTDVLAADSFARTATNGWGTADTGGAWTVSGGASNFSVSGGAGMVKLASAGVGPVALLNGVSAQNTNSVVDVSTDKIGTGSGTTAILYARRSSAGYYQLKLKLLPSGVAHLAWSYVVGTKETSPSEVVVKNLTYTTGTPLRMRFVVSGDGTTTTVRGRVWVASTAEPTTWQVSGTDSTAALQGSGSVGIGSALASNATNAPVTLTYDNYSVRLG